MVQHGGLDSASVGVKLPNGTYERPIGNNRLLRVRPGKGFSPQKTLLVYYLSAISCFLSHYNET